ncbi:GAK5 protein, partial [Zosterops hypoxanthus]|nr:GAK5 protein [Zosterops hypoxanthus]
MAAAFAAIRGSSRTSGVCFGCGKPGHLKRDCPALKEEKPKSTAVCSRCRRGQHFSNQCHSKYDSKGCQIQGNQNWSVEWHCAQTQMPQPPQMLPLQMLSLQVPNGGSPQVFP